LPRFRERGFKESFRTQAARGDGFGSALEKHADVGRTGPEEANNPAVGGWMRTEEREGIGEAARKQRIHLGLKLRIFCWCWCEDARER
jgi:hypothetical protein